jgi:hypothetical protein
MKQPRQAVVENHCPFPASQSEVDRAETMSLSETEDVAIKRQRSVHVMYTQRCVMHAFNGERMPCSYHNRAYILAGFGELEG